LCESAWRSTQLPEQVVPESQPASAPPLEPLPELLPEPPLEPLEPLLEPLLDPPPELLPLLPELPPLLEDAVASAPDEEPSIPPPASGVSPDPPPDDELQAPRIEPEIRRHVAMVERILLTLAGRRARCLALLELAVPPRGSSLQPCARAKTSAISCCRLSTVRPSGRPSVVSTADGSA